MNGLQRNWIGDGLCVVFEVKLDRVETPAGGAKVRRLVRSHSPRHGRGVSIGTRAGQELRVVALGMDFFEVPLLALAVRYERFITETLLSENIRSVVVASDKTRAIKRTPPGKITFFVVIE